MDEDRLTEGEKAALREIEELNLNAVNTSELEGIDPLPVGYFLYRGTWKTSSRLGFGGAMEIAARKFNKKVKSDYTAQAVIIYNGCFTSREIRVPVLVPIDAKEHYPVHEFVVHSVDGPISDSHTVTFEIKSIKRDGTIEGVYNSQSPNDSGTFSVKITKEALINARPSHDRCSIA